MSSSASVGEATASMAVLGPHALALALEPEALNTPREFRAVRMYRRTSAVQDTQATAMWEIVFSTGSSAQERELKELVHQARQYMRGSNIYLGSRSWVVWDVGRVGTGRVAGLITQPFETRQELGYSPQNRNSLQLEAQDGENEDEVINVEPKLGAGRHP